VAISSCKHQATASASKEIHLIGKPPDISGYNQKHTKKNVFPKPAATRQRSSPNRKSVFPQSKKLRSGEEKYFPSHLAAMKRKSLRSISIRRLLHLGASALINKASARKQHHGGAGVSAMKSINGARQSQHPRVIGGKAISIKASNIISAAASASASEEKWRGINRNRERKSEIFHHNRRPTRRRKSKMKQ